MLGGGLALNVRIGRLHRATNDVDTVAQDQPRFVEILLNAFDAASLSAAKVLCHNPEAEVEVMASTEGQDLPFEESDRAFALARRFAIVSATPVALGAVEDTGRVVAEVDLDVATRAALIALKTVAIPRRIDGAYPAKIGSDIQDLYRLVDGRELGRLAALFSAAADPELVDFVARLLTSRFTAGSSDLRYALARLRRLGDNPDSRSTAEEDLALLAEFGAALA